MKLTKETLKRIIKEELESVINEQETEEAKEEAEEMLASPKADEVLSALASKPEIASALEAVLAQAKQTNESNNQGGGLYGPEDGSVAAKAVGATVAAGTMLSSPLLANIVVNSQAGKQLMDALAPYVSPALTSLGMSGAVMAGSVVAGMAIALASNEIGKKK